MSVTGRDPSQTGDPKADKRSHTPTMMDRMRSLFGISAGSVRDEIEDALDDQDEGVFSPQERTMLKSVLALHEIRVEDVMVPRADMIAIGLQASLRDVLVLFREAGHSRLPVHGNTLDDPKGMVHIRDFVHYITGPSVQSDSDEPVGLGTLHIDMAQTLEASGVMRPVLFVPPSMQALDLLVKMQTSRTHMALVIDEFGGTDGLVTIEDIVEVIVGDIEDEHDEDERPKIVPNPDGSFVADARADLDAIEAAIGHPVATEAEKEEVDTLGGLVTALAGHVPNQGERVTGSAVEFEILEADARRVKQVRIIPKAAAPPGLPRSLSAGPKLLRTPDPNERNAIPRLLKTFPELS